MKRLSVVLFVITAVLSDVMCAVVAYNYRDILCSIEHAGFSAPADLAFLYAVPFLVAIAVCLVLAIVFYRKSREK